MSVFQRILLGALVLAIAGLSAYFLWALRKGFRSNRKVMIRLEEALGCYKEGEYLKDSALYPQSYKKLTGSIAGHFWVWFVWLGVVAVFLLLLVAVSPGPQPRPADEAAPAVEQATER